MTKILKKLLIILLLVVTLLNAFSNIIYGAVQVKINTAKIKKIGEDVILVELLEN